MVSIGNALQKSSEIHSFIPQIYTEHPVRARYCSSPGDTKTNKTDRIPCLRDLTSYIRLKGGH